MTRFRSTTILMLTLVLCACGSTPQSSYYRLSASGTPGSGSGPALGVGPITVPEYLNRNSMIFSEGDNELHVASFQRWAEPLQDGITRVVGLNLSSALDTQNIRPFPWPPNDSPDYAVQIWILSVDTSPEQTDLAVEWRLRDMVKGKEITRRIGHYKGPGANFDGAALSAAYSDTLRQLSEDIATAVRASMTSPDLSP